MYSHCERKITGTVISGNSMKKKCKKWRDQDESGKSFKMFKNGIKI
jgi:hypothetical protein